MDEAQDVPLAVGAIVAAVTAEMAGTGRERGLAEVSAALRRLPGMETRDGVEFRCREHEIFTGLKLHLGELARTLGELASLELAAAPVVVADLPVGPHDCVLVTRYRACAGEWLIPARSTREPFRPGARARFRKDMELLLERQLLHPYAGRGLEHWLVGSETGTLVLGAWAAVRRCRPSEAARWLEDIDDQLRARAAA